MFSIWLSSLNSRGSPDFGQHNAGWIIPPSHQRRKVSHNNESDAKVYLSVSYDLESMSPEVPRLSRRSARRKFPRFPIHEMCVYLPRLLHSTISGHATPAG